MSSCLLQPDTSKDISVADVTCWFTRIIGVRSVCYTDWGILHAVGPVVALCHALHHPTIANFV